MPPCTQAPASSSVDAEMVTPGGEKVLVCPSGSSAWGTPCFSVMINMVHFLSAHLLSMHTVLFLQSN